MYAGSCLGELALARHIGGANVYTVAECTAVQWCNPCSNPSELFVVLGLVHVARSCNFHTLQNASAPSTWFWPEDSAWPPLEAQVCMSLDKIQNTLASAPPIAAQLMRSIAITNRTILSDDFKAGQPMQTLEPGFSLTLSKRTE